MHFIAIILIMTGIIYYCYLLAKKKSPVLSIGLILLLEIAWLLVSIAYIDCGTFITEQGRRSYFTGASIRLLLIYAPFLYILPRQVKKLETSYEGFYSIKLCKQNVDQKLFYKVAQILLFAVISYGMLDIILVGAPLFSKTVTRTNFWKYSKLPLASKIMGEVTFFLMLINGKKFAETKSYKEKTICILLLSYSVLHRLLMSYKYDGLYQIFFMFFICQLYNWLQTADIKKIFSLKTLLILGGVVSTCLLCVFLFYVFKHNTANPFQLLMDRLFSLQSATFWGEDLRHIESGDIWLNFQQIGKEIGALFNGSGAFDKETGMVNVMYNVSPLHVVETYLSQGLRFYGNFATVALNCFGYVGTAVWGMLIAVIFAYAIVNFAQSLKNSQWIMTYVSLSLFLDVFEYFRIGNFSYLFNIKTLLMLTILIVVNALKKRKLVQLNHWKNYSMRNLQQFKLTRPLGKISICMCTYNGEAYIQEQLDSIVAQTVKPYEIIVYDDKSTDKTVEIVKEYAEKYPDIQWKIHVNEVNTGWRINFKNCLQEACGEIIFLADQDDIWNNDKLEVMGYALANEKKADVLVSDYTPFYMNGTVDHDLEMESENTMRIKQVLPSVGFMHCLRPGCTFALKKAFLKDFVDCWQKEFAHDAMLWRIACLKNRLYAMDYSTIQFRRHDNNASSNKNKRLSKHEKDLEKDVISMYKQCLERLRALDLADKEKEIINKVEEWLDKRFDLYTNPSIWKWIKLVKYYSFYRGLKHYLKDLNAVLYKRKEAVTE